MAADDKNWAQKYINDPLTAPDPSDETGPGSSFLPKPESPPSASATSATPNSSEPRRLSKSNPFMQSHGSPKETSTSTREVIPERGYPSPPTSSSPRHSPRNSLGHRQEFMGNGNRPRRSSSLKERYPGDPTVHPLDQLAREKAEADRARHMTKKHAVPTDMIDNLDNSGLGSYHHEGPFDATLFARNNSYESSPVAAVSDSNREALRATPHDKIIDSVRGHRPLDGVAAFPPGVTDRDGHTYKYQEGDNMMTEENAPGGPYKRWPGVQYHPDDIKGKETEQGIEMSSTTSRSRSGSGAIRAEAFADDQDSLGRRGSLSNKLKRRVGSLKKKLSDNE